MGGPDEPGVAKAKVEVRGLHPGVLRKGNTRWKCPYPSRASPRPNRTINQEGEQGASKCFVASFLFWCRSLTYVMPFLLEVYLAMVEKVVAVMAKVISGTVDRNVGLCVAGISAYYRNRLRDYRLPVALLCRRAGGLGVFALRQYGRAGRALVWPRASILGVVTCRRP